METKIKGLCKGFKYISQIFVVKEREMEIGYPTDVKHVAHIGWDGPSGSAPIWMSEFKTPDFSTTTVANPRDSNSVTFSTWSSQGIVIVIPSGVLLHYKTSESRAFSRVKKLIGMPLSIDQKANRRDFDESMGHQTMPNVFNDIPPSDLPNVPKKPKTRKKKTSSSSPNSSSSTSRISRKTKQKAMQYELESTPEVQVQ
ncbi:hypothetical protein POTOM_040465 [Populus tomentosa]|uniref:CRIB domain-containing protein n=1 Tax=Populus tomentosa TaxID=118781 RepID=A0A8X8CAA8_POPTO|nr:hypothetical protein POTOM_040465 [Populus tomentosa]